MKIKRYIQVLLLFILTYTSCVKEFEPESQGYTNLLVVNAFLSNGDEPFEVTLSRSVPIDTSYILPETGAAIRLTADNGESYALEEEPGSGRYTQSGIEGQIGRSYQLHIQTRDGREYISEPVVMRETPPIDSITYEYDPDPEVGFPGIQIRVTTHDPANNTKYYRWEWDETWIFYTPIPGNNIYEGGQILAREENINRCWKSSSSTSIKISSSENLTQDIISDFPLLYVSSETDRLRSKYSINVKQYALSEESYNYWLELEKVTESLGTLFDPQPSTIYSNIKNVNDESEIVLGYFDASSVAEDRIFIRGSDVPGMPTPNYYAFCSDTVVSRGQIPEMMSLGFMLGYETLNEFGAFVYVMSDPYCIDCRFAGTNQEPDFWE